ncbi:hypothetical protein DES40_2275 [Litorimonas taeanensis]|uniref:Uncharacterized protein n=1 Tax=Litorimonas taeanensis TaxID=568099 RepID=A0A420WER7_9PROT|nr:hypothetical protein DES40_2275 [Litorimonas taeanensis]
MIVWQWRVLLVIQNRDGTGNSIVLMRIIAISRCMGNGKGLRRQKPSGEHHYQQAICFVQFHLITLQYNNHWRQAFLVPLL